MRFLFAGSFDPFTLGHHRLVARLLDMGADQVIIHLAAHPSKPGWLSMAQRQELVQACWGEEPRVVVSGGGGLTSQYAQAHGAVLVRGVRNATDWEYEHTLAAANRDLFGVETLLLPTEGAIAHISASLVREMVRYQQDISTLVPPPVARLLQEWM